MYVHASSCLCVCVIILDDEPYLNLEETISEVSEEDATEPSSGAQTNCDEQTEQLSHLDVMKEKERHL